MSKKVASIESMKLIDDFQAAEVQDLAMSSEKYCRPFLASRD